MMASLMTDSQARSTLFMLCACAFIAGLLVR